MSKRVLIQAAALIICMAMLFQAGCAGRSRSAQFYVLSPAAGNAAEIKRTGFSSDVAVAVAPVSLPKYLKKPQIVTRTGSNELQLAEFDRWAGRLEEDIGRVIAENLAQELATDKVIPLPVLEGADFDYTIEITLSRFDGLLGGDLELAARWAVFDNQRNMVSGIKATHIIEPTSGREYADMVAAQSRALAVFSNELAAVIKELTDR